jgi:hypothetical protein
MNLFLPEKCLTKPRNRFGTSALVLRTQKRAKVPKRLMVALCVYSSYGVHLNIQ